MSQHPSNPNQHFTPWQWKVKWQMEQAKITKNWPRYRELYRKLHRPPAIARAARRSKKEQINGTV